MKESIYVCNFLSFDSVRHQSYSTQHIAPRVWTNVGQFSLFWENQLILVFTLYYENLIGFLIFFKFWLIFYLIILLIKIFSNLKNYIKIHEILEKIIIQNLQLHNFIPLKSSFKFL